MTGVIPTFCSINQFNTRELRVPFHQSTHCPFLLFPLLSTTIPRTINSSSVTYEIYKNNQINLCENFVSPKREVGFQFSAGIVNLSEPSAKKKCLTFGTVFQYKFLDAVLKKYKNSQFNSNPAIWPEHVFCLLNLL